jgi:hypothetical protein
MPRSASTLHGKTLDPGPSLPRGHSAHRYSGTCRARRIDSGHGNLDSTKSHQGYEQHQRTHHVASQLFFFNVIALSPVLCPSGCAGSVLSTPKAKHEAHRAPWLMQASMESQSWF